MVRSLVVAQSLSLSLLFFSLKYKYIAQYTHVQCERHLVACCFTHIQNAANCNCVCLSTKLHNSSYCTYRTDSTQVEEEQNDRKTKIDNIKPKVSKQRTDRENECKMEKERNYTVQCGRKVLRKIIPIYFFEII